MTHSLSRFLIAAATGAALLLPVYGNAAVDPEEPNKLLTAPEVPRVVNRLISEKNWTEAMKLVEDGLTENPHSAQLRFQRCVIYERSGETEKAVQLFEDFIRRYPEIPEAYNNLAGIYSRQGQLDRAQELLVKAVALRPDFAMAHANLGNLYLARAKNAFNTAIQSGANRKEMNRRIELIDAILQ